MNLTNFEIFLVAGGELPAIMKIMAWWSVNKLNGFGLKSKIMKRFKSESYSTKFQFSS